MATPRAAAQVALRAKRRAARAALARAPESAPRVVLLGRPNVGKSTLFNRLAGRAGSPPALVHSTPGTTRDRREGLGGLGDLDFAVIDTAGLEEVVGNLETGRVPRRASRARRRRAGEKSEPRDDGSEAEAPATHHGRPLAPELQESILRQTQAALRGADVVLFMIDAREGVTPTDEHFARWIRRQRGDTRVIVVANKCEVSGDGDGERPGIYEAHSLGLGDPVPLSAHYVQGFDDLYAALKGALPARAAAPSAAAPDPQPAPAAVHVRGSPGREPEEEADAAAAPEAEAGADRRPEGQAAEEVVRVAVVGRPNVGKSTLVNSLLGEERMVTGAQPGVTRDAVASHWRDPRFPGQTFELVDTAGLKGVSVAQHARFSKVDQIAMAASLRAIELSDVVLMVLDATQGLNESVTLRPLPARLRFSPGVPGADCVTPQELAETSRVAPAVREALETAHLLVRDMVTADDVRIAERVVSEGRPLVVVPNKWDSLAPEHREHAAVGLRDLFERQLHQVRQLPIVPVSALTGHQVDLLSPAVAEVYRRWNTRVRTNLLNQFLRRLTDFQPPPRVAGQALKLRFITQNAVRPPTFTATCSRAADLPGHYSAFVVNSIRKEFGLQGVPIRFSVVRGANPYDPRRAGAAAAARR